MRGNTTTISDSLENKMSSFDFPTPKVNSRMASEFKETIYVIEPNIKEVTGKEIFSIKDTLSDISAITTRDRLQTEMGNGHRLMLNDLLRLILTEARKGNSYMMLRFLPNQRSFLTSTPFNTFLKESSVTVIHKREDDEGIIYKIVWG